MSARDRRDRSPPPPPEEAPWPPLPQGDPDGPPLVVIAGPTAVGKSGLAMALAERFGGAIVSADSRQLFREFDVGTAKPSAEERARVPHDLIDHRAPTETYTVAEYQRDARAAVARHHEAGRLPLLVGGTGLYLRAVLDGLTIPAVPPDAALRAGLAEIPDLHAVLALEDPVAAARLHPNDRFRITRAIEVFRATGRPIGELQETRPCPYRLLFLALTAPRERLYARIDARAAAMVAGGLPEEVAGIAARHGWTLPLLGTLGYAEVGAALRGETRMDEALDLLARRTRNYAKRQLAWLRPDPRVAWLRTGGDGPAEAEVAQVVDAVARLLDLTKKNVSEENR